MNIEATTMREKQLNIRLSEEEATRLAFLQGHYGLNGANLFRMLLKKEADAVGANPLPNMPRPHRAARAGLEEATDVSFACPNFFRASITQHKYADAGFHLAMHARQQATAEEADKALDAALAKAEPEEAVFQWIRQYLPRCFELVPAKRAGSFKKGIASAIEQDRV